MLRIYFAFSLLFVVSCSHLNFERSPASIVSRKVSCAEIVLKFPYIRQYHHGDMKAVPISSFDENLQVTQFLYGRPGVLNRKKELMSLSFEDLNTYIKERSIPYVMGPDGRKYIIDRHHFSLSLYELKDNLFEKFGHRATDIEVYFQEVLFEDLDTELLERNSFIKLMMENKLAYLRSGEEFKSFDELPKSVGELREDYYRGLSWLVRKSGAYKKTDTPFAEFYWADYLKKQLNITDNQFSKKNIKKAIRASIISNDYNSSLPGFRGASSLSDDEIKRLTKKYMKKLKKKGILSLKDM